ncbi:hypothetical protein CHUAL_009520 [Chamberlinius hualienensis]
MEDSCWEMFTTMDTFFQNDFLQLLLTIPLVYCLLQVNVRVFYANQQYIIGGGVSVGGIIVASTETWLNDKATVGILGHNIYKFDQMKKGGRGLMILVPPSMSFSAESVEILSDSEFVTGRELHFDIKNLGTVGSKLEEEMRVEELSLVSDAPTRGGTILDWIMSRGLKVLHSSTTQ